MTGMTAFAEPDAITIDGTTQLTLDKDARDASGRLPSVAALARAVGGAYAENAEGMTIDAALAAAQLDFTVTTAGPLTVPLADGTTLTGLPRMCATIAEYPGGRGSAMLGVVGTGYGVVQPRQAAEFGQGLLEEAGATVVAACAYGDPIGSRMVLGLKLPEGLTVGGDDPHDLYLFVGNSWNRSTGLWACVAPIRVDCTNQAAMTFGSLSNRFSIRHTARAGNSDALDEIRRALRITDTFSSRYAAACEQFLATPMTGGEVVGFVEQLLPTPKTVADRGVDNWASKRAALVSVITGSPTNQFGQGTRYAAYQGTVEWADHMMGARTPVSRYARLVDGGDHEKFKAHAAATLLGSR